MPITLKISPSTTLDAIYGEHLYYSGMAPFGKSQWVSAPRTMLNFRGAAQMSIVTDMSYICHASVATERGLAIMGFANMPYANNLCVYDTDDQYSQIINTALEGRKNLVLKFVYPEDIVPVSGLWNSRTLTCALNNKKNLHLFVSELNLPRREHINVEQIACQKIHFPVVVKAPIEWSTGSGSAVSFCYRHEDITSTLNQFAGCTELIFEEFLEIERSFCVQFATLPDGGMRYLGMAEQITGSNGNFCGSWLEEPEHHSSRLVGIGEAVMQAAVDLGYLGIAGFDIAICKDGRIMVIDLNFRPNGSTAAVLLYKDMAKTLDFPVMRNASWKGTQGFTIFDRTIRKAIDKGTFLPLSVYDPEHTCSSGDYPMVSGVVAGATKAEVNARMLELGENGLVDLNP